MGRDFIRTIIDDHVEEGRYDEIVTRFPPEPNGYLHLGHAKSVCLNFGIAREYGGRCHLRFDDTNPLTEDEEYTRSIARDIEWLGYDWGEHLYHASDYFDRMFEVAVKLVREGKAYVDSSTEEEIREARGTVTEPGRPTRFRDRPIEESLDLFHRMRAGEFQDGAHVLRGKIDLASPNMIMRDPIFYRIRHAHHYRTGDEWCIYPMYDFAHCLEDAFEGISHSLCTLEFDNNREIYDWILDEAGFEEPRTHQYEFARLNLDYTVLSKRKLIRLVKEGFVDGWDDPRMPTLAGVRRRGIPPAAIRTFADMIGVAKADSRVDLGKLEYAVRDELNRSAPRRLAVLDPLRVVLTNWPEERVEILEAPNFPDDIEASERPADVAEAREIPFAGSLWIERDDFQVEPEAGFRRLAPGRMIRLRHGYLIRCDEVIRDGSGEVAELRCAVDLDSLGSKGSGEKVWGAIHWVSAEHAVEAEVRLYDRLFSLPVPEDVAEGEDFTDHLNPDSLEVVRDAKLEPVLGASEVGEVYQFERLGYFVKDADSTPEGPAFNRTVTLRDTWGRRREEEERKAGAAEVNAEGGSGVQESKARPKPTPEERISDERRAAREADPVLDERFDHYREGLGLSTEEADILTGSRALSDFFEEAREVHDVPGSIAAWVVNEVQREVKDEGLAGLPFTGRELGRLVAMVDDGRVSRVAAKEVFAEMVEKGSDPEEVVLREGLEKITDDDALTELIEGVLAEWPEKVDEYRAGNANLLGLFIGQVMKASGGSADPKRVRELLLNRLQD